MRAIIIVAAVALAASWSARAVDGHALSDAPGHIEMTDDGPVLVAPSGMTLYVFVADETRPGKSLCTNQVLRERQDVIGGFGSIPIPRADEAKSCADKSPPFMAGTQARPVGRWSLMDRTEGGKQWTYNDRPLYFSIKDQKPGDRFGATGAGYGNLLRIALAVDSLNFPTAFDLTRFGEDVVIATKGQLPVYTPTGKSKGCNVDCGEMLVPIAAPAIAHVSGDWSVLQAASGQHQYAFKGKPLYSLREGVTIWDIEEAGGWGPVIFRKGVGTPSEIKKRFTILGDIYADQAGMTLYAFKCDAGGGTRCDDPGDPAAYWAALCKDGETCMQRWHPYLASANARPIGDWSIVDLAQPMFTDRTGTTYPPGVPRVKAWAYLGQPVYTYYQDKNPTEVWGHVIAWTGHRSYFTAVRVPGRRVPGAALF